MNRRQLLASTVALALPGGNAAARFYGATPTAAPPSGAVTTFRIKNTSGGTLATPRLSIFQPLAQGDVPSGSHLELRANDGVTVITSQQDQEPTWAQDGSFKGAAISFVSPDTFASNQIITYQLWAVSGAPNRSPSVTLANLAANADIKAHFTAQTLGSDVFEVGVNDIITNGTNWPWGANPMRGWEVVRVGPICCEWRFWSYLRRTSDDAFHKWLKGWVYVRSWGSAGPYEIAWGTRASNIIAASGTVGGASTGPFIFDTVLLNGGTTLQAWGGAADPRTIGVASTAFDTATKTVSMPPTSIFGGFSFMPGGVPVSFSGSVGTGIDTSAIYWTAPYGSDLSTTSFETTRPDCVTLSGAGSPGVIPAWAPNTSYTAGAQSVVRNDGGITYRCITTGTSASSGGPTGNGTNITDGAAHWTCIVAAFTTQGSGTITITPHCQCYPFTGQIYLDQNAHRLWSGATRPDYEMVHDFTYLTTQSRAMPPYLATGVSPTADATLWTHSPGNQYFVWSLNMQGDNIGDDRIGWMMCHEAKLLYLPFDVTQHQNCRVISLTFAEQHIYIEDEAVGKIPIMNNGHLRNGTTYSNLGVCRPEDRAGPYGPSNIPAWLPPGADGILESYAVFMDSSHGPMPGYLCYLKSGDDLYREYMLHIGNMNIANQAYFKAIPIGSITYQRLIADTAEQARGIGWGVRWLGNTRHLMPATDPLSQYWNDEHAEQALYMEAWRQNVDAVSNPGSLPTVLVGPPAAQVPFGIFTVQNLGPTFFADDIMFVGLAMEAWRGEVPGYGSFVTNLAKNLSIDRVDESSPMHGCMFMTGTTYQFIWDNPPDNTVFPADWDAAWANMSQYWHDNISPPNVVPYPWACPASGMFDLSCCGGSGPSVPNSYANFTTSCHAMWTLVGPPGNHGAALYAQARAIQYGMRPPLSFNRDPSFAIGPIGATG